MRRLLSFLPLLAITLYVTGCGFTADKTLSSIAPTAGTGVHGIVHGGQAPVVGATVSVWAVGTTGGPATVLATTTSDSAGNFAFTAGAYTCGSILSIKSPDSPHRAAAPHPRAAGAKTPDVHAVGSGASFPVARPDTLPDPTETYVYITATGGNAGGGVNSFINLGAGLGKCIDAQSESVEINEVSTVILANVMANFYDGTGFSSSADPNQVNAMEIALTNTFQTIDDLPTGTVKPNTVSLTGGTSITIEAAKIYSIANTIASCVNSSDLPPPAAPGTASTACTTLFSDATYTAPPIPPAMPAPIPSYDTFSAALFMCYSPYSNVSALYNLGTPQAPFMGGLTAAPNDWSVGISYSTSAMGLEIYESVIGGGSSSTIDLDRNSRVWFPSNKSGAVGIAYFDPTDNTFNGPYGGSAKYPLTLPQYVALDDPDDVAWATDALTAALVGVSTSPGSEGTVVTSVDFVDPYGGTSTVSTGPLFVNSDESVVINYDDSLAAPLQITFDPFDTMVLGQSAFSLQPTGLTVNTTQGSDPDDPGAPGVVAVTSDLSSACDLEFSSASDGNAIFVHDAQTNCLSGGVATTAYNSANGNQDEVAAISSTNALCSVIAEACSGIPEYLSFPEGVAFDGGEEVWIANRGSASIFYLLQSYDSSGTPEYSLISPVTLLHDASNGGTMVAPTGIAVDRGGNIWVSNTSCTSTTDTTCIYTLSEVFGVGYPTLTPLSLQAARLQGTTPGSGGGVQAGGTPQPMFRRGTPVGHGSLLRK